MGATTDAAHLPKLDVLNISSPSNPQSTGSVVLSNVGGIAESVAVVGSWAFFGRPDNTLNVVSLASPASPNKVGTVSIPNAAFAFEGVAASGDGNYVYVASGVGIQVVDVTVKAAPVLGQLVAPPQSPGTNVNVVHVTDNRLFAAINGFIFVFDISSPASPQIIAYYDVPGACFGLSVVGEFIYSVSSFNEVTILRLLDVSKPTVTITSPTLNPTYSTANATLSLGGAASDDKGVVRVSWQNDRGGGGTAQGTTAWTIPAIQLAAGSNVITVTAEDAQGNLARDTITVTATLPDANGPSIVVTGPNPSSAFSFAADTLPLTGTAADASGVQAVSWANDRGGSGAATGTSAWTASIPLFDGPNRITLTARDTVGNDSHAEVLVTYTEPDATAPTVSIVFPTDQQEAATSEPMVNLSGEADDDRSVLRVRWRNSAGGSGEAEGTLPWTANGIALAPGLNVITVTATDSAGNEASDALAVTYTPTVPPLPLRLTGAGQITGDAAEGAVLNVGQTYTLRAVPGAGEIFGGWSGSIVSESAQLTFTAEEGMEVVANFMASPFPAVKGGYVGLVETEPFARGMSGSAGVQVTGEGAFSAVLRFGAETVRFAGAFDSKGRFTGQVVRTGKPSLQLVLALELTDGRERLTGLISDGTTTAAINADPALSPAPQRGRYTAVLERDTASTALPAGVEFGTMIVGADGSVRYAGRLGDGSAVTLDGYVTTRGQWPVYAPLYNGRGALIGRVNFRDIPQTSDLDGRLHWQRPGGSEGDVSLMGSTYARPAVGSRVLGLPRAASNARLTFSDGLLASPVERSVTINAAHQASAAFAGYFKMTLDVGVGTFTGEIQLGGRIGRVGFGGVLLPKTGVGRGQVRFSNGIGEVELAAP